MGDETAEGERNPSTLKVATNVRAELDDSGLKPLVTISFDRIPDAKAYYVDRGQRQRPIGVALDECAQDRCQTSIDKLSIGAASSVTVVATAKDRKSPPSKPVRLPAWPKPPGVLKKGPDDPIVLTITRIGSDGKPRIDTERVHPNKVEKRAAELEARKKVIAVVRNGDALMSPNLAPGRAPTRWRSGAWQQHALDYGGLPGDPRTRGTGTKIALIDSGVDTDHESLRNADVTTVNMLQSGRSTPEMHGTAMAPAATNRSPDGKLADIAGL